MKDTKTFICEACGPVTDTRVVERSETYPVKGEPISVLANVRVCERCGQDVYDRELDSENLGMAYSLYRRKHRIISPDELQAMREKYDLSQRGLGTLLGWGEVTIHRYENGSLPDDAHNQVLRFIQDPFNMERVADQYGDRLHQSARNRLTRRLSDLLTQRAPKKVIEVLAQSSGHNKPDEYTGFQYFNAEILMEMIVFFAGKTAGVFKTKLNKLLWYADFTHFRLYSVSISGATYIHLTFGPVPDMYEFFLSSLCVEGSLRLNEIDYGDDIVGEKFLATREVGAEALSSTAIEVLESVYGRFKSTTAREITRLSHEENGYINTQQGEPISYLYAKDLKVNITV
jgi:putative zinc finger/helix-turn-helix YgiT family protein